LKIYITLNYLFPSLMHYHLRSVWQEFLNRPVKQQLLEDAINIFSQWYYMKSHSHMYKVDDILQHVMEHLRNKCSKHLLFSISNELFSYWKCNNIEDTKWNYTDSRQILDSLCEVISELNFHEIKCCESNNHPKNFHI